MDVNLDNSLQWSADEDAVKYELKMVAAGGDPSSPTIGQILDHTTVPGAFVDLTEGGVNSVPFSALVGTGGVGVSYDIFIRGFNAANEAGPWSDGLRVTIVSNVAKVVDLVVV